MKSGFPDRQIRWYFRVGLKRQLVRLLYAGADGIGFCVALIRFQFIPWMRLSLHRWKKKSSEAFQIDRAEPNVSAGPFKRDHKPSIPARKAAEYLEDLRLRSEQTGKKYTYSWAVTRLSELEASGIADPVAYFNNEMTDWWLAPDGMMEQDADFLGIAMAIEERWHQ
ncbi:hypothetical protein [Sneathiella limimaris]|uniref:hypothetical protein n=1 Tax=Sneathiella limimaris TaxID=1964213 RepID=UPI00146F28C3|nr:hypothetical protein [Sneathiella limimaris]